MNNSPQGSHQGSFGPAATSIHYIFLTICFILAVIFRIPYLSSEMMGSDEALYAWCAQSIYTQPSIIFSKEIIEYHPPLFPLILSIGNIFSDTVLAYRVIAMIFSLLGVATIYMLGTLLQGRFVGLVAAILLTTNYTYLLNGTLINIDIPLLVFCNLLIIILVKTDAESSFSRHFWVGIISSLIISLKFWDFALRKYSSASS